MTQAGTSWWPPTRKVRKGLAAFVTLEAAAFAGELTTGFPGWQAVIAGAITGAGGLVAAYLTRDESSPA